MLFVLSSKPSVPFKEQLDKLDLRGRENTVFILFSHYFLAVSCTNLGNCLVCNISAKNHPDVHVIRYTNVRFCSSYPRNPYFPYLVCDT